MRINDKYEFIGLEDQVNPDRAVMTVEEIGITGEVTVYVERFDSNNEVIGCGWKLIPYTDALKMIETGVWEAR